MNNTIKLFCFLTLLHFSDLTLYSQTEDIVALQEKGALLCGEGKVQEGILLLESAMNKAKAQELWTIYPEIAIYHWYAYYQLTGNPDTVLVQLEYIDSIAKQHLKDSIGILGNIHIYKSMFLYYAEEDAESRKENEIALSYFEQDRSRYLDEISSIYNNLGVIYSAEGNVNKAEDYIKKALALKAEFKKMGRPFNEVAHLSNYLNLAGIYYKNKRYDDFKKYMALLESEIATIPNVPPNIQYRVNQKLATYYLRNEKDYPIAKKYLNNLIKISKDSDIELFDITGTEHLRAEYHLVNNDTLKAEEIWVTATERLEQFLGLNNVRLTEYYLNITEFFARTSQYDKAAYWSDKALVLSRVKAGDNIEKMDSRQLQIYAAAIGSETCLPYFDKSIDQAKRFALIEENGNQYLATLRNFATRVDKVASLQAYLDFNIVITALMEVKYHQYKTDPSKLYEAMELFELKQSLPLLKNQKDINLAKAANIEPKLTETLSAIKVEMERLRSSYSLSNTDQNNATLANIIDSLSQEKDAINSQIKDGISKAGFPVVEPLTTKVSSDEPQAIVGKSECLLQFLNDRSELYIIAYTPEEQFLYYSDEPTLNDELIKIRSYLGNIDNFNKDSFQHYSHILYNRLIKPLETFIGNKDLVIMPTGSFNYVPFEVLLKELKKEKPDYLLRHHAVRYVYSVKTVKPVSKQQTNNNKIAFAPDFGNARNQGYALRDGFDALAGAQREIENISKSYSFQQFVSQNASKDNFLKECKSSQIIHLASHAVVDQQNPLRSYVVFDDADTLEKDNHYLYAYELYQMNLNADMAVLSACNTGIGKLSTFDGVISLAKAFEFAGVRSTVMSLWPAQDEATSEIMSNFYTNLATGDTKSKALQKAKLTYLDRADAISSQPFFWASFIVQGDNSPIPTSSNNWLAIAIGIVGLLLVYFMFSRRRSKLRA